MMRPLEPHELFSRCDVAGEARVLALLPGPSAGCSFAKLDFERLARGRLESVRGELPTIAFVQIDRALEEPRSENERRIRIERFGKEPLTVLVAGQSPKSGRLQSAPIVGRTPAVRYEVGTRVSTYLSWDPQAGCYRTTSWNAVSVLGSNA